MDSLQNAREEISRIDRQMAELFCRRMDCARQVAAYKKEHALPVTDPRREAELLRRNLSYVAEPWQEFYPMFLQNTMAVSRRYQQRLLEGLQVAFCGEAGAFAHMAAGQIFPGAKRVPCKDFAEAFAAVEQGTCDCAVLPLENSFFGEVGQVTDLLFAGSLYINGIYELPLTQHLMALPGVTPEQIKTVLSHPQALGQCARWLNRQGLSTRETASTAEAARLVAHCGDPTLAAIASRQAAEEYGLCLLHVSLQSQRCNTTRFAVFSRSLHVFSQPEEDNHFILLFTVNNQAGALARAIDLLGRRGFNLSALRSRPRKDLLWEYYFYLEVEGNPRSPEGQAMLQELAQYCQQLRVAGSFQGHRLLEEEDA